MPPMEHISRQYDSDLEAMRTQVLQMGGLVESQIQSALEALRGDRPESISLVLQKEGTVNLLEVRIDEECAHLIARRQPAAGDLRLILAASKTVTDLERIGDEANKIARMAKQIFERGGARVPSAREVNHVAELAVSMLHKTLDAFARLDVVTARQVIAEDLGIDNEFRSVLRQIVTFMMEDPRTISNALDVIWVAKAIERIGDHAKNIAQFVIYVVEGTDVRHSKSIESESALSG